MNFNIDSKTISKQIAASKLKQKVIVTSIILLVVVAAWFILDYTTRREPTIDESITSLANSFSFRLNPEVFADLDTKERYPEEELSDFSIYLVDETALARGNSLTVTELGDVPAANIDPNVVPEDTPAADETLPPEGTLPDNVQTDTGGPDTVQEI